VHSDGFRHPDIRARAPYGLITMNILAEPLLRLATDAEGHLAESGVMILSGILLWQEPQIRDAYQGLGLELASRLVVDDWVTLCWQKP
jgi:ribosomal protein L11 methyltransferase